MNNQIDNEVSSNLREFTLIHDKDYKDNKLIMNDVEKLFSIQQTLNTYKIVLSKPFYLFWFIKTKWLTSSEVHYIHYLPTNINFDSTEPNFMRIPYLFNSNKEALDFFIENHKDIDENGFIGLLDLIHETEEQKEFLSTNS